MHLIPIQNRFIIFIISIYKCQLIAIRYREKDNYLPVNPTLEEANRFVLPAVDEPELEPLQVSERSNFKALHKT